MLNQAIALKPGKRFAIPEILPQGIHRPTLNRTLDEVWLEEAEKRLAAHREGRSKGIPMEEIFAEE